MIEINRNNGNSVKVYAETFEYEAFEQVKKLANYEPYTDSVIRIMPDAHAGKGCTIGTTMTLNNAVTPNLVGVDIGCGMLCTTLKLKKEDLTTDFLARLDETIRKFVPSGFEIHEQAWNKCNFLDDLLCWSNADLTRAVRSVGTLGGGNHFIELNVSDKTDDVYLVIHTGSRNLGVQVCKFYQDLAFKKLNEMTTLRNDVRNEVIARCKAEGRTKDIQKEIEQALANVKKPSVDKELAHLTGNDFKNYIHDMEIVQYYAALNRKTIADIILKKMGIVGLDSFDTIHNYIDTKNMILRKGAVSAQLGEKLLIPMNMRDGCLIGKGLGNEEWNFSAPHGAGRLMSRAEARGTFTLSQYKKEMKGIFSTSVSRETLDESPMAYKPMESILSKIEATAEITERLIPVYNFKSGEE